jgi:hypothetical protein
MIIEPSDRICALPRSSLLHVMSWLRKRATPVSSIMIQQNQVIESLANTRGETPPAHDGRESEHTHQLKGESG